MAKNPDEAELAKARLLIDSAMSSIDEGMVGIHQMFLQLQEGGFTETQALRLIAYLFMGMAADGDIEE